MVEDKTTETAREAWWRIFTRPPATVVIGVFGLWWLFVIASGSGMRLGGPWDFTVTGQLGDSFGILSCLMASLAAIFTYQTLNETRRQAATAEAEADRSKAEARLAIQRAKVEKFEADERLEEQRRREYRRDNEQTFFRLLELRSQVLNDLQTGQNEYAVVGSDAAGRFVQTVKNYVSNRTYNTYAVAFRAMYERNQNDLGHYFRTTYHVVRFLDDRFQDAVAYEYVRILRAQLSNAEIVLIALNCWYGEGAEKFAPLAAKYALFHNMNEVDRELFSFDEHFPARAFDPEKSVDDPPLG